MKRDSTGRAVLPLVAVAAIGHGESDRQAILRKPPHRRVRLLAPVPQNPSFKLYDAMKVHDRSPLLLDAARWFGALLVSLHLTGIAAGNPARTAYERGNESVAHNDYAAAIRHFNRAIQLDPRMANAWFSRGWAYGQSGDPEQEISDLSQCIRLEPNYAEAYCNRGAAHAKLGRWQPAIADLNTALKLDPNLGVAWSTRGWVRFERGEHKEAVADYTQALRLDPNDVDAYGSRAKCLHALGEYDRAIADFDRVLKVYPKDADLLGSRGVTKVAKGDLTGGAADLAAAIQANPHDVGAKYIPRTPTELSSEAIEHGEEQLRTMIKDRPSLGRHLTPDDALWKWAVRQLAGEALGEPIDWDPVPPRDSEAEHVAPVDGRRGRIRVKPYDDAMPDAPPDAVFEALWSHVVFELHNIAFVPRFDALRQEAAKGRVSKRQFVERTFHYEHEAIQQTRAFYVKVQLPWAARKKLKSDATLWFADLWLDVDAAFNDFTDPLEYPWNPYTRQYDWLRVHALFDAEKYREAMALLSTMLAEEGYQSDAGHVRIWIGECQMALNDLPAALEAVNAAIAADPEDATAYELRAEVYKKLGETVKAAADLAKVRLLDEQAEKD